MYCQFIFLNKSCELLMALVWRMCKLFLNSYFYCIVSGIILTGGNGREESNYSSLKLDSCASEIHYLGGYLHIPLDR